MSELFHEQPRGDAHRGLWVRRAAMALFAAIVVAALLNAFGQEPAVSRAQGARASLQVSAPEAVRGGLLLQGRIRVLATGTLTDPQLVLSEGWFEGMQVNTIEPAATDEAPADGRRVALTYG